MNIPSKSLQNVRFVGKMLAPFKRLQGCLPLQAVQLLTQHQGVALCLLKRLLKSFRVRYVQFTDIALQTNDPYPIRYRGITQGIQ